MFKFYKYQSLGNDFIILDWLKISNKKIINILHDPKFKNLVINSCNRHYGIGADGILVIKKTAKEKFTECLIFNKDGSNGDKCLNGIRCIAYYLYKHKKYPDKFTLQMASDLIICKIVNSNNKILIETHINNIKYLNRLDIILKNSNINLSGHVIDAGNPHFVVMQKITTDWLVKNGKAVENHPSFPNKTNVEFVYEQELTNPRKFNMLAHERGCGITLACGSGAAATIRTLKHLQIINSNEKINIIMPGGKLETHIDSDNTIIQLATATEVFCSKFLTNFSYGVS